MSDATTNYAEDIRIDPDALDIEWVKQASLFGKYAALKSAADRKVNECEQRLKVRRSQLLLEARDKGAKNAAQEEAYYRTHPDHQALKKEWIDAQYEADILGSAVSAFGHKKSALENLVRLQSANYFAGPSVPRDIGAEWIKQTEHSSAASRIKAARKIER